MFIWLETLNSEYSLWKKKSEKILEETVEAIRTCAICSGESSQAACDMVEWIDCFDVSQTSY